MTTAQLEQSPSSLIREAMETIEDPAPDAVARVVIPQLTPQQLEEFAIRGIAEDVPGTPLSDGHKHARAMRAVSKAFLKDLWLEARRVHRGIDTQEPLDPARDFAGAASE